MISLFVLLQFSHLSNRVYLLAKCLCIVESECQNCVLIVSVSGSGQDWARGWHQAAAMITFIIIRPETMLKCHFI